jgi:hypothetical protein
MSHDLAGDVDGHAADARQRAQPRGDLLAHRLDLRLRRVRELDVDRDVVAGDADLLRRFRGDEVLAGIGIDDLGQRGLDVLFSDGHDELLGAGARAAHVVNGAQV